MNIIFWITRGIGNNDSRIALSDMYRLNNPAFLFIAEPMVVYDSRQILQVPSIICSHLYREGNCCVDTMAAMGLELDATT